MRGTALVTGASRRIGRVLAIEAAKAGYDVAIHHRGPASEAEAVAAEIVALGRQAAPVSAELTVEADAASLIGRAAGMLGPVTLLINNASIFQDDRIETVTHESWSAHMETNLWAPVRLAQAFADALPAGAEGQIINILDQRVWKPNPQFFSYGISRAGLWSATRVLAQALAPRIRVNAVGPGPTLPSIHQRQEDFAAEARGVLLERRAAPEDVAAAVRYLIEARQVTGQMIAVDGGQHLAWRTPDVVEPVNPAIVAANPTTDEAPSPTKGRIAATKVFVRGLKIEAEIGVYEHEFGRKQPLIVEVELDLVVGAGPSDFDHIVGTFNYESVLSAARSAAEEGHFILVEGYAERVGQLCLEDPRVTRARVRVDKPHALAPAAEAAGAEIVLVRA